MYSPKTLAVTFAALSGFYLLAQQQPKVPDPQPATAPAQAEQPSAPAATPAPQVEMSSVKGELVGKLDSKTAKAGDSIVIKTKSNVKTADGTEIPKGSKLMGRVTAVQASGQQNENSQVVLQFDHAELKGGQNLAIRSEIRALSPAGAEVSSSESGSAPSVPSVPPPTASPSASGMSKGGSASPSSSPGASQMPSNQPGQSAVSSGPAVGTVVARTGNIAIRTTAIPGVLLANNEPGTQDPRMAQSSGILLGAKRNIQLDGGTEVEIGVAATQATGGEK